MATMRGRGRGAAYAKAKAVAKLRNTEGTKERADYLNSKTGLAVETVKGLPKAAVKVGKAIVKAPMKAVDNYIGKSKKMNQTRIERDEKMQTQNWGSPEEYREMMKAQNKLKGKKR